MRMFLVKFWRENKSVILFVSLMMVFRSAVADWSDVPTGSMKPTILEGDRIFVNKMAYDIRVPFSHISLLKVSDPKASDIIIFDSKVSDKRLVKRVIGTPGDVVSMVSNRLIINGQTLNYELMHQQGSASLNEEEIDGNTHMVTLANQNSPMSSFDPVVVPEEHYLVLGDNRDHSADSRVIGFVPRNEIVGRSSHVVLSLDYENYWLPRSNRFLQQL